MRIEYTDDEKKAITAALKNAAVALAEVWDAVRDVEHRLGIEINFAAGPLLTDNLAPECNIPPSTDDLDDAAVWEAFVDATEEE